MRYYIKVCKNTRTMQVPGYNDLEGVLNIDCYITA